LQDGFALSPYSHSRPTRGQGLDAAGRLAGHVAVLPPLPLPLLELPLELPLEPEPEPLPELLPELPEPELLPPPSGKAPPVNVEPPQAHRTANATGRRIFEFMGDLSGKHSNGDTSGNGAGKAGGTGIFDRAGARSVPPATRTPAERTYARDPHGSQLRRP